MLLHFAGQSPSANAEERKDNTEYKGCNIQKQKMIPQDSGISVEDNGNQQCPK